ncbi:MAG: hypothetical protein ACRDF6_13130 [bacterium]
MNCKRALTAAMLVTSFAAAPVASEAADATFYELTENMTLKLDDQRNPISRKAIAALQGTAKAGSPLCPDALIGVLMAQQLLSSAPKTCTVTAVGIDEISLASGSGWVKGTFSVVLNADNPVDPAELEVMTGSFSGTMQIMFDMRGSRPVPLPLLTITEGKVTPE